MWYHLKTFPFHSVFNKKKKFPWTIKCPNRLNNNLSIINKSIKTKHFIHHNKLDTIIRINLNKKLVSKIKEVSSRFRIASMSIINNQILIRSRYIPKTTQRWTQTKQININNIISTIRSNCNRSIINKATIIRWKSTHSSCTILSKTTTRCNQTNFSNSSVHLSILTINGTTVAIIIIINESSRWASNTKH